MLCLNEEGAQQRKVKVFRRKVILWPNQHLEKQIFTQNPFETINFGEQTLQARCFEMTCCVLHYRNKPNWNIEAFDAQCSHVLMRTFKASITQIISNYENSLVVDIDCEESGFKSSLGHQYFNCSTSPSFSDVCSVSMGSSASSDFCTSTREALETLKIPWMFTRTLTFTFELSPVACGTTFWIRNLPGREKKSQQFFSACVYKTVFPTKSLWTCSLVF